MKTRAVTALVPLIAVGLLAAGPAQAKQPIPGITQTAQWRALKSYVNQLEAKRNTPASAQQKTAFRQKLSGKRLAANARVKKLYSQRIQRIVNRDQAQERRQIQKLQNAANRQVDQLKGQRAARLAYKKASFASQIASIQDRYATSIDTNNRQLKRLERNLRRTRDPFQRQVILQHIDTIENDNTQLKRARTRNIENATDAHREAVSIIRRKFATRIADTRNHYRGLIATVRQTWKTLYANEVKAAKSKRTDQFQLVTNLWDRGEGYIEQMPAPPP